MALSTVTVTWDEEDVGGDVLGGYVSFQLTSDLQDQADGIDVRRNPARTVFFAGPSGSSPPLVANDNAVTPAGTAYVITVAIQGQAPVTFTSAINHANGASQSLAFLQANAALPSVQYAQFLPLPSGTASSGQVPVATGAGEASAWGFSGAGATVVVPKPTGATATDTPNVTAAITSLTTALASGPATLLFQDGTYQVDSNSAVIRSVSNFAVRSSGATVIQQAPNRGGLPNNTTGNIFTIADCTDFTVSDLTLDGMRDAVAPLTPLTATASSGQPSVTVAAGQGANYQAGQGLWVQGGLGTAEQATVEGPPIGAGTPRFIASITPGGGSGGGDLITFTTNLSHSYTLLGSTAYTDAFGPYAYNGAFLTPYQAAHSNSVAGRTLSGEDQQNGLHLISCKRAVIERVTARNVWESPLKLGTGEASTSLTDGCSNVTVSKCTAYHGYDQGVSAWVSDHVTVSGCLLTATGWTGISFTGSDNCTASGNEITGMVYRNAGEDAGHGITIEGGIGCQVHGNVITDIWGSGVRMIVSPLSWGLPGTTSNPTLGAFLAGGTTAGTSVQVSATAALQVGGRYSLADGYRTEAVTVASIVDSTHVTFASATLYPHASGIYLGNRCAQGNAVIGNSIRNVSYAVPGGTGAHTNCNGIEMLAAVRNLVHGNQVTSYGGSGINLNNGNPEISGAPAAAQMAGDGSVISANTVAGTVSGGGYPLLLNGPVQLTVTGNDLSGPVGSGTHALISAIGVTDSLIQGNRLHDNPNGPGINTSSGGPNSIACTRLTVTGNVIYRVATQGIALNLADSCIITGNRLWGCGTADGAISLYGCTNSTVEANACNSNSHSGIALANNSSTGCTNVRVTGNTCRNDSTGTGANPATGGNYTQQTGILESGNSNFNLFTANECDGNSNAQLTTAGANSYAWANILSGVVVPGLNPAQDYGGMFGDGSDGTATLDGTATVSWASKASSVYTLTRDAFLTSLTVNSGVTLNVSGFRVFCQGPVANAGTVAANGNSAASATGAGATTSGTLQGGLGGGGGGTTTGTVGANGNSMFGTGNSNAGGTGASGAGGGGHAQSTTVYPHRVPAAVLSGIAAWQGSNKPVSGAAGGGGGGGDGANSGGGGGGGGAIVAILAWSAVNTGTISANGGNGFTPVAGNCGGGGGGGGGLILVYTLSAWTAGTTSVTGGTQGSGTGTGTAGTAGSNGTVLNVIVQ